MARRKKQEEITTSPNLEETELDVLAEVSPPRDTFLARLLRAIVTNQHKIKEIETKLVQLSHLANRIHANEANIRKNIQELVNVRESLAEQMTKIEQINNAISLISERQAGRTFILDTDRKRVYELEAEFTDYKKIINDLTKLITVMQNDHEHHKEKCSKLEVIIQDISTDLRHVGKDTHQHDKEFTKIKSMYKTLCIIGTIVGFVISIGVSVAGFFLK